MFKQCVGIKKNGDRCNSQVLVSQLGTRCGIHRKTLDSVGPNTIRRIELKYKYDRISKDIKNRTDLSKEEKNQLSNGQQHNYYRELDSLNELIMNETIQAGGVDADRPYRLRNIGGEIRILRIREENLEAQYIYIHMQNGNQIDQLNNVLHANHEDRLGNIANDRQSVHTTVVVEKVKTMVDKIIKIEVPSEYQTETLKTTAEIILECKLSKKAAWQMMSKYCDDESIYELGNGIYANVLNCVWQYIKSSPDANDLKKILAVEMEDNIGMCSQGNLSRLCNILSGYIDGLVIDNRSILEVLGDKLSNLMSIDNKVERLNLAEGILKEMNIPEVDWSTWIIPLSEV